MVCIFLLSCRSVEDPIPNPLHPPSWKTPEHETLDAPYHETNRSGHPDNINQKEDNKLFFLPKNLCIIALAICQENPPLFHNNKKPKYKKNYWSSFDLKLSIDQANSI